MGLSSEGPVVCALFVAREHRAPILVVTPKNLTDAGGAQVRPPMTRAAHPYPYYP